MNISVSDLEQLTIKQLLQVAPYYGISLTGKEKKSDLIQKMLEVLNQPISPEPDIPMSARVRRIKEINHVQ